MQETIKLVQTEALDVLTNMPNKPFFCLPMSALLYALLRDKHGLDAYLITGDLTYRGQYVFKQDFSITKGDHSVFKTWAGHAWVEVDGFVWDLSFFRTLYSKEFNKPYMEQLIALFGTGRGLLAVPGREVENTGLKYHAIDTLSYDLATGIIKGIEHMP